MAEHDMIISLGWSDGMMVCMHRIPSVKISWCDLEWSTKQNKESNKDDEDQPSTFTFKNEVFIFQS